MFFEGPYRYLRIAQNGKNASNQTYYLSLSGFEVYGNVVDVVVSCIVVRCESAVNWFAAVNAKC